MAILLPPAAANTGGALPTPPTSTDPAPIACSIGGPEVKSDQATLNGSLPMSPAAVSNACAPVPAWSPTCSVTPDTLAWLARLVQQEQAGLADQGAGQRRPLGLAAGQGQRPGAGPFGQADLLQRPAGHRAGVRHAQPEGHVGQRPAPRQQPRLLERDRDRPRH